MNFFLKPKFINDSKREREREDEVILKRINKKIFKKKRKKKKEREREKKRLARIKRETEKSGWPNG